MKSGIKSLTKIKKRSKNTMSEGRVIKINVDETTIDNTNGGKGIEIKVDGYKGNPECPDEAQIFIEVYEGKLRVHVWNGNNDPETIEIDKL
jgi:hypothetical protein